MAGIAKDRHPRQQIYVVDDSATEAAMARSALESAWQVTTFPDGATLLEALAARAAPDLVVLDWLMPNMNGLEVLAFLRRTEQHAALPVLLLTAQSQVEQIVEGLSAGADDYLAKPFAPAELRARVSALLRGSELRERAALAERTLRRMLAGLPDAVLTFDRDGRVLFANDTADRLFGRSAEELLGATMGALLPELDLLALQRGGILPDVEVGQRTLSPRVNIPPSDQDGNTTISLRDVTELRRRDARRLDFYSMIAHDLRSPLSVLLMRAQMLQRGLKGELPEAARGELDRMGDRVRELVGMINDFIDVSQFEGGQFRLEREPVDLNSLFSEVVDEYRAIAEGRELTLAIDTREPPRALVDRRRVGQVLGNLVSNAIKYTPAGGRIAVRVTADSERVRTEVSDDGRGVEQAAQPHLFRVWMREGGRDARVQGSGLGLAIVREIVEAHGGEVGVTSEVGKGSTFWFTLPRAKEAQRPAASAP